MREVTRGSVAYGGSEGASIKMPAYFIAQSLAIVWQSPTRKGRGGGQTCDGGPPAAGVVVEEAHLDHGVHVVPVGKHDEPHAVLLHVAVQLGDLLLVKLLFRVDYQQGAILHPGTLMSE